jgi:putative FmdB family regulatory protein
MPIFEYACQDCGREFEAFVTAARVPACPACQGVNLARQLSRPGMVGVSSGTPAASSAPRGCGAGGAGCACRMGMDAN